MHFLKEFINGAEVLRGLIFLDDDGGEPIEYYEVEKLDTDTGRWVPCAKMNLENRKTPEVTDWDADRVSLEWQPPDSDGGAPITQYIIEKRGKHGRATGRNAERKETIQVSGDETTATILGLKEGEEYQFRVKAVNKAGPGEASDPSRKVIAKPRNRGF
ncbi:fibronectin type III domain protein [Cooperia oncophora]